MALDIKYNKRIISEKYKTVNSEKIIPISAT